MTAEREKAINEWLRVHCPKCANNDFLNCQCECEVQKDVGITCIHYEEYVAESKEEKAKLCQESYIAGMEHNCEDVGNAKVEMRDDMAKEDNESVKKEEKTGHWMHWIYSSDYVNDTVYKCSECGFEQTESEKLSRCPKCKSKMQEYGD